MEYVLIQALPHKAVLLLGRLDPSKYLDQNSAQDVPRKNIGTTVVLGLKLNLVF